MTPSAPPRLPVKLIACAAVMVLTGCGGKTVPVNGRVKFTDGSDATALAGYEVSFEAEAQKISGAGTIQPDGSFKISTYTGDDGAVPGRHRVAVTPPSSPDPDKPPPRPVIPKKYFDFPTSDLTVEIQPGKGDVTLELERAP